jgi:leader peptidase (prepilin peptidase) / N-methyltransferase
VLTLSVALFGLIVGSFLNVCIYRLPRRLSIVWPASRCTSCGRALRWYENIPVLSYLALRARCRTCRARISIIYPVVELLTAITFVAMFVRFGLQPLLAVRLVFGCAMIVLLFIDLRHRILPNAITVPGIIAGVMAGFVLPPPPGWLDSLVGAVVGAGVLLAIGELYLRVRHEEGLGMGDVKMLGMIGAFLGWKLMLVTMVIASLLGSIVGVTVIVARKGGMKSALPFGTFLAIGALVAAVAGDVILDWYLGFY